jgi:hypothetical protein
MPQPRRELVLEARVDVPKARPQGVMSNTRFALGGKRMRRIGIVALARRLLIALWRYGQRGAIPEGASLKPL